MPFRYASYECFPLNMDGDEALIGPFFNLTRLNDFVSFFLLHNACALCLHVCSLAKPKLMNYSMVENGIAIDMM